MTTEPVILIGGVTGGIGADLARRMAAGGWGVAGFSRNADKAAGLAADVPELLHVSADATQPEQITAAVTATLEKFGRIDAYVHCVGSILLKAAHQTRPEEWHQVINVNLNSAFYTLKAVLGPMQAQNAGSIVFVSSVAAQAGLPNHEAIAAAKGGINGLVLAAAATYAPKNIRVNAVAPGLVDTPMAAPLLSSEAARQFSEKLHPLGRCGTPANVSSLIAWLVSAEGSWTTGQIWSVDGGMAHVRPKPKV